MYEDLLQRQQQIYADWKEAWIHAGAGPITQTEALATLKLLWERTHLDVALHKPSLKKYLPTVQGRRGRLKKVNNLWWVDHATAGTGGWGTMSWFSSLKVWHAKAFDTEAAAKAYQSRRSTRRAGSITKKNGKYVLRWKSLPGAVTHFIEMLDGTPMMLLPLHDGCWGEPKRNGDGIHIEVVNPLVIRRKSGKWYWWAGRLKKSILDVQQPVRMEPRFRGAKYMLPYLWEQVITNIKLKRLCIAATGNRMARSRMSQHTDWRRTKFDMGPLWPFNLCNDAAFETFPVEEYDFIKRFVRAEGMDPVVDEEELEASIRYAEDPYSDYETQDADTSIDSVIEIQTALTKLYANPLPKYGIDGDMGNETTTAVRRFQANWNDRHKRDRITVDGIPGTQTCARLERAVAGEWTPQ